ncbi:ABC transporter substrate-binding protein [Paenibacillus lycopersici]|uniref:ABC transporter substrate-binding protein n=1 Tax=Paenibacillus lycopersici TaxID=2704462 RepID=A0A6C0FYT0_9BACL|nr:ABC transporter substrate-binding protein [Paenibacillus lycopersici]QHT59370.1 ABC transporter substrate-binding protein [Paenibacillus lycopersici]
MKKQIGAMLALSMVSAFALAGCGTSNEQNAANAAGEAAGNAKTAGNANAASEKPALKPYKLVMYYPGSTPGDLALVQDEISKYLTEKINATIELKPIDWGAYGDKSNLMFTSNEKFDLMFTASYLSYNVNVAKGQFLQVDELLDQYGQGIKDTLGPDWLKGSQVNGHNYAVPTLKEFAGAAGMLFRKDLVDKYNIDLNAIHTLSDLTPIFQTIKDKEPGVTPLVQSGSLNLPGLLTGYSLDYLGDSSGVLDPAAGDLKVVNLLETKQYVDSVHQMRQWYQAGFINKDASTLKDDQLYNIVKAGKGFAFAVTTKPGKDAEMSTQLGVELVQKDLTKPQTTTGEATGAMLAISRTSGDPERAMMFLNLLYTDKTLLNMLDFGIEGKHYVKNANGMLDYPEGVTSQTSGFNPGTAWMFGNQLNTYLWSNEDPQKWEKFKAFNDSSTKSPALGFVWDPTNVKNEVSAVGNAGAEFGGAIMTGTVDPDKYLPQYNAKLKAAGLEKIIAEKQKQLDAWAQAK